LIGSNPPPDLRKIESDQIVVTGWVDDLRPYLGRCSVFVAPIRLGVGVRGKILEAWAMGKAVVATPLACAGLHARHGETALLAETAEQFSESIVQVLRNDSLRRRLGENGRTAVEKHFSWDAIVAKHLDTMYSSIRQREAGIRD
jgi:glycosyltransferase involved in cell wall biosynthesis